MKKVDWLIAAFFVTIGLVCLTVSAMYYQGDTFMLFGSTPIYTVSTYLKSMI
ncbi:hypothetical protein ABN764_04440 [Paenibacillaceae sp. P-4]|uniref:hypothetical protein n=1 Tax=Paenibacillaceae bacterium P-4 TaxID=3160969 RepID=UPI0032E833AA